VPPDTQGDEKMAKYQVTTNPKENKTDEISSVQGGKKEFFYSVRDNKFLARFNRK
jgi:hypothetical protein